LPLYAGWAGADITPSKTVALAGQMQKRVSTEKSLKAMWD